MFKIVLEKAEEPEIKLPTSIGSLKKKENSRKTSSTSLTTLKLLTVWITANWKFFKRWEYQTILPASWEICMQVKKQQLEPCMEKLTHSGLRRVQQGCLLSPCLFNLYAEYIIWNAGLESRWLGEISTTLDMEESEEESCWGWRRRRVKKPA